MKGKTSSIPKKGIPKLDSALRADHCSLVWTRDNALAAQSW